MTLQQWKEALAEEKKKLSALPWPQKIGYILNYYKFQIIIFIIILTLLIALPVRYFSKKEPIVSVMFINASVSEEGYQLISEDFFEEVQGDSDKEMIQLYKGTYIDYENPNKDQMNYAEVMKIIALLSNSALDVIISDESALDAYGPERGLKDMETFLPEALYEEVRENLVTRTIQETGEVCPVAIDISDTAFIQTYGDSEKNYYLSFPDSSQRNEDSVAFLEYLLSF